MMADDSGNEDQWLYGDSNPDQPETEAELSNKNDDTDNLEDSNAVENEIDSLDDIGDQVCHFKP